MAGFFHLALDFQDLFMFSHMYFIFEYRIIFNFMDVSYFIYSVITCWTYVICLPFGYCEYCYCENYVKVVRVSVCVFFFGVAIS